MVNTTGSIRIIDNTLLLVIPRNERFLPSVVLELIHEVKICLYRAIFYLFVTSLSSRKKIMSSESKVKPSTSRFS